MILVPREFWSISVRVFHRFGTDPRERREGGGRKDDEWDSLRNGSRETSPSPVMAKGVTFSSNGIFPTLHFVTKHSFSTFHFYERQD